MNAAPILVPARPQPLGRILTAAEAGLYGDAAAALAHATAAAEALRAEAAAAAAAERTQLLVAAQAEAAAAATERLARTEADIRRSLQGLLPEIAAAIAQGVAKVISGLDVAEAVAAAACRAVSELAERHGITVRVADSAVRATRARLAPLGAGVRVLADPELAADACVVETSGGFVRADLGAQLAAVAAALGDVGG